jgi:hypothetical protein
MRYRLPGLPEILNEEFHGLPDVGESLVKGPPPSVATFEGGTIGMVSPFALRKGIFLDDHPKYVRFHGPILLSGLNLDTYDTTEYSSVRAISAIYGSVLF